MARGEKPRNNDILFISDLHAPYHHPDALEFLAALKKKYNFARIVCVGDELDYHAMSFHDSDPDLDSAGRELQRGREVLWELWRMFPLMDLLESNHGSMAYRKGKHHGVPRHLILGYKDAIFGEKKKDGTVHLPNMRGVGWNWHFELIITLSTGQRVKIVHNRKSSTLMNVKETGMSFIQGHHHTVFEIVHHHTTDFLNWGMTVGCLIDDASYSYAYNKFTVARPIIGCGAIIDGRPKLLPMILKRGGLWNGDVP